MKKFKPVKVKNSSIRLPDEFLDALLINEGDSLLMTEENGRYYIRKTRKTLEDSDDISTEEKEGPPKTFEEIAKESEKNTEKTGVFGNIGDMKGLNANDLLKMMENTLKDPNMRKMIENTAKGLFDAFDPENVDFAKMQEELKRQADTSVQKSKQSNKEEEDDDDDDDDESNGGVKINID